MSSVSRTALPGTQNCCTWKGALGPAERVDAELRPPGRPSQVPVERRLDAGLADAVSRAVALILRRLQLVLRDLADVAEDLGRERLVLVVPQEVVTTETPGNSVWCSFRYSAARRAPPFAR